MSGLARLLDRAGIRLAVQRGLAGLDARDPAGIQSGFWPDARVRYGAGPRWSVDELLAAWSSALPTGGGRSHHMAWNDSLESDDDGAAWSETYYLAAFPAGTALPFCGPAPAGRVGLQGGRLVDRLERRDGEWRVAERHVVGDWFSTIAFAPVLGEPGLGGPAVEGRAAANLDELLAQEAIADAVLRWARGVDRLDRGLAPTWFVADAESHPIQTHYVTNLRVDLDLEAGQARVAGAILVVHHDLGAAPEDAVRMRGGDLEVELARSARGAWEIEALARIPRWAGSASGELLAAFRAATGGRSHRDRRDRSYELEVVDTTSRSVDELVDRELIRAALARYARGLDRLDRPLADSAFVGGAPAFVGSLFDQAATRPVQHHGWSNLRIQLAGDTAHLEATYLTVLGFADGTPAGLAERALAADEMFLVGGRYLAEVGRGQDGGWGLRDRGNVGDWHAVIDGSGRVPFAEATGNPLYRPVGRG